MNLMTRRNPGPATLSEFFSDVFSDPFFNGIARTAQEPLPLDISEDEKNVIIRASLPGYTREDINLEIHDGVLTISAEHTEETEKTTETFYRRERRTGAVSRRVRLPETVTDEHAKAELKDGVLTLRIAKNEKALPRKVEIN